LILDEEEEVLQFEAEGSPDLIVGIWCEDTPHNSGMAFHNLATVAIRQFFLPEKK
jgi:hypothetical protein